MWEKRMLAQRTNRRLLAALLPALALSCAECDDNQVLATTYDLCITPAPLDWGILPVRTSETKTAVVVNCGGIALEALEVEVVADDDVQGAGFTVLETEVDSPLSPGANFILPVRFFGKTPGLYNARLLFKVPDRVEPIMELALEAEASPLATCDPIAAPDPLAFGSILEDEVADRALTLTNQGLSSCALAGARVTEGQDVFTVVDASELELPPGESVDLTLRFAPEAVGSFTGAVAVVAGGESEVVVPLTGEALSADRCALVTDPPALVFPRAAVGFSTSVATARLESVGELPCEIASVTTSLADFIIDSAPSVGTSLSPAGGADLALTFSPSAAGAREANLTFETADGATFEVPLIGFADPTPSCGLAFSPAPVVFDPIAVGLDAELEVTITNVSELACEVTGASLDARAAPDLELIAQPTAGTLNPGDSTTARIRFQPQAAAPALATLSIGTGQSDSRVDVIGFADYAEVVLTPGFRFFGFVTEGCSSPTYPATLTNTGEVAARIDEVSTSTLTDPNFEVLTTINPATMIQPGESVPMAMRMLAGPAPGPHAGHLQALTTGTVDAVTRAELTGTTESIEEAQRTDIFRAGDTPMVDILFVVDNSGSMQQEQTNLAQNFSAFIQFTTELEIDYHIGVVTTDTQASTAGELVAPFIFNRGQNATPDPVAAFVSMVNVGTTGSATEKGLEAAVLAITEPVASGANAGFLRDGGLLSIIYVSDEEDSSPGDVGDWIDKVLSAKGYDADAVIASAIAGDVPGGCDRNGNSAQAGGRYSDTVLALGGIFESICTPDWATTMEQIGLDTFSALTRFTLSRTPDQATLTVTVGGQTVESDALNGWTYDPETNSVRLNGTSVPESGEDVVVTYTAECIAQ
jgi:hypothetical protein